MPFLCFYTDFRLPPLLISSSNSSFNMFFPILMLCEIAGIEPTYRTMNPIKQVLRSSQTQVLRSSQTGALCLKHKKINEEIFLTYAIASKIAISTISMTNIIENILNAFFISLSPPFYFFSSTINCSGSAPTYVPPTTAGLSPRRRLLPLYGSLFVPTKPISIYTTITTR